MSPLRNAGVDGPPGRLDAPVVRLSRHQGLVCECSTTIALKLSGTELLTEQTAPPNVRSL